MGKHVELLAPAGNPAAFYGAVNAGADAVYLGSRRFGARAYAENFADDEIIGCIRYGHIMGCKLYLTVNTLLKEAELEELYGHILPFYESGLDGVIVQDFGVLRLLRESFPGLELHASTQMSLCSAYGAELLREMGASRIVPAREISLEEIREIKSRVDIEVEAFIHGAMCYCYSGQCLFSSLLGGRSGNRGRCAQPCRLPYSVEAEGKNLVGQQYFLSMKDMCTIGHMPELIEARIDSFKIEGRMKKPEYAAGVTAVYRRYIDLYYETRERYGAAEAAERFRVEQADKRILSSLYIRSQVQDGYYFRRNGREMLTLKSPAYSGSDEALLADIGRRYLAEKKRLPVAIHVCVQAGKAVSVTFSLKGRDVPNATKDAGEKRGMGCDMTPYNIVPYFVTVTGGTAEAAANRPVTEDDIRRQMGKLGDSPFYPEEIVVETDGGAFFPLGRINELRRQAVRQLEEAVLRADKTAGRSAGPGAEDLIQTAQSPISAEGGTERHRPADCGENLGLVQDAEGRISPGGSAVLVSTREQLAGLAGWLEENPGADISWVYLQSELAIGCREAPELKELSHRPGCPLLIALPYVLKGQEESFLDELYSMCGTGQRFSGFLVRSADGLGFLRSREKPGLINLDASLYIWNRAAAAQLGKDIDSFCLPYELNAAEQRRLLGGGRVFEKVVYGRIPMMVTANCILRTLRQSSQSSQSSRSLQCGQGMQRGRNSQGSTERTALIDRYGKRFPIVRSCAHCTNIIYNSVPLSLHKELSKWKGKVRLRLDLTVEDAEGTRDVLDVFFLGKAPEYEYTTGHEKRGVM